MGTGSPHLKGSMNGATVGSSHAPGAEGVHAARFPSSEASACRTNLKPQAEPTVVTVIALSFFHNQRRK